VSAGLGESCGYGNAIVRLSTSALEALLTSPAVMNEWSDGRTDGWMDVYFIN